MNKFLHFTTFGDFSHLRIIAVFHLVVEHIEVSLGHGFLLAVEDRCDVRAVRFLGVPQGEEISGLHERRHELRVAQRLHARVLRVDGMLNRSFPISILIHHLRTKEIHHLRSEGLSKKKRSVCLLVWAIMCMSLND